MKKRILVFDFDGTIADTEKLYVEIINKSLQKASYIYPRSHIVKALGPKLEQSLLNLRKFDKRTLKKLSNEINGFVVKRAESLKICRNVKSEIHKLKKSGEYRIILLTNSVHSFPEAFLRKNGMLKDFDMILGSEDFTTKENALRKLAKRFKADIKGITYIGDRVGDFRLAKHVGSRIIIPYSCSWDKSKILNKKYSKVRIKNLGKIEKLL